MSCSRKFIMRSNNRVIVLHVPKIGVRMFRWKLKSSNSKGSNNFIRPLQFIDRRGGECLAYTLFTNWGETSSALQWTRPGRCSISYSNSARVSSHYAKMPSGLLKVLTFETVVICLKDHMATQQVMSKVLHCSDDSQQLSTGWAVITFGSVHYPWVENDESLYFINHLGRDGADCDIRGVHM